MYSRMPFPPVGQLRYDLRYIIHGYAVDYHKRAGRAHANVK